MMVERHRPYYAERDRSYRLAARIELPTEKV
jgi:hypothetical protein